MRERSDARLRLEPLPCGRLLGGQAPFAREILQLQGGCWADGSSKEGCERLGLYRLHLRISMECAGAGSTVLSPYLDHLLPVARDKQRFALQPFVCGDDGGGACDRFSGLGSSACDAKVD